MATDILQDQNNCEALKSEKYEVELYTCKFDTTSRGDNLFLL